VPSLLLLSLGHGAVPAFLADRAPAGRPLTLGYVPDAARADATAPWAVAERDRVVGLGHAVVDVRLTGATAGEVADALDGVDALYVAGGNTFALLDALGRPGPTRSSPSASAAGCPTSAPARGRSSPGRAPSRRRSWTTRPRPRA
jgi:dipeptidase E